MRDHPRSRPNHPAFALLGRLPARPELASYRIAKQTAVEAAAAPRCQRNRDIVVLNKCKAILKATTSTRRSLDGLVPVGAREDEDAKMHWMRHEN